MANPQTEDGYTMLSNDILEALGRIRIPGEARQIFDVILRKTYGFKKKEDRISLSQFVLSTGIMRPNVVRAIQSLLSMKLIIRSDNKEGTIYSINKDFDTWKRLSKQIPRGRALSEMITPIIRNDNTSLSEMIHTKENKTKENKTKEKIAQAPEKKEEDLEMGKKVNLLLGEFQKTLNENINFGNRTFRDSSARLIKRYGLETLLRVVNGLVEAYKTDQFMPTVTSPYELELKWGKIMIQANRKKVEKDNKPQKLIKL